MSLKKQNINVAFVFDYLSENGVLEYFLRFYAKKSGLKFAIEHKDNKISLLVNGDEKDVLNFADNSMSKIPNSIFIAKTEVVVTDDFKTQDDEYNGQFYYSNITPYVIENYIKNNKKVDNEFGIFSNLSIFKDKESIKVSVNNFDELLNFAKINLIHNQKIKFLKNNSEFYITAGIDFEKSNVLIPTSAINLSKVFVVDEKKLIALNSFEKPVINTKISTVFRKNKKDIPIFFDLQLADDIFLFALAYELSKEGIEFIGTTLKPELKIAFLQEQILVIKNSIFTKNIFKEDKFSLIEHEFNITKSKNLHLCFSATNDYINYSYLNDKFNILKHYHFSNFSDIKAKMLEDDVAKRLFDNYSKSFEMVKNFDIGVVNFYNLFNLVSKILFGKDIKFLFDSSKNYPAQKGCKIDFYGGFEKEFDLFKFIRSGMSFKLAGVDDELLSYGYIESFAYYIADLLEEISLKLGTSNAILSGDIFENERLTSLILKYTPKNVGLKISNQYGL